MAGLRVVGSVLIVLGAVLTWGALGVGPPLVLLGCAMLLLGIRKLRGRRYMDLVYGAIAGLAVLYVLSVSSCIAVPQVKGSVSSGPERCTSLLGFASLDLLWRIVIAGIVTILVACGCMLARGGIQATEGE